LQIKYLTNLVDKILNNCKNALLYFKTWKDMKSFKINGEFKGTIEDMETRTDRVQANPKSVRTEIGDATGGDDSAVRTDEGNATGGDWSAVRTNVGDTTGGHYSAVRTEIGDATGGDYSAVRTDEGDATGGNWSAVRTNEGTATCGEKSVAMGKTVVIGTNSVGVEVDDYGNIMRVILKIPKDREIEIITE
jgi:hypothetical protein